jgi:hypothetical protein
VLAPPASPPPRPPPAHSAIVVVLFVALLGGSRAVLCHRGLHEERVVFPTYFEPESFRNASGGSSGLDGLAGPACATHMGCGSSTEAGESNPGMVRNPSPTCPVDPPPSVPSRHRQTRPSHR